MANFSRRIAETRAHRTADGELWAKLRTDYPNLAEALLGVTSKEGGWESWPHTLMIYNDSGTLKWSLHCKATKESAFGCFADRCLVIDDVESALAEDRYDVRKNRG